MAAPNAKAVLHRPATGRFVVLTFLLGLLVNLMPWSETAKLIWPDLLAMLLIFWITHQPRHVGLGSAWFLGLLMDIADGALFGQHALAYTVMGYLTQVLHRRLQMFSPWQQALYVFVLLLSALLIMLLVRLAFGSAFPGVFYFASSVVGAALWPTVTLMLQVPQRRRAMSEDSYQKLPM